MHSWHSAFVDQILAVAAAASAAMPFFYFVSKRWREISHIKHAHTTICDEADGLVRSRDSQAQLSQSRIGKLGQLQSHPVAGPVLRVQCVAL